MEEPGVWPSGGAAGRGGGAGLAGTGAASAGATGTSGGTSGAGTGVTVAGSAGPVVGATGTTTGPVTGAGGATTGPVAGAGGATAGPEGRAAGSVGLAAGRACAGWAGAKPAARADKAGPKAEISRSMGKRKRLVVKFGPFFASLSNGDEAGAAQLWGAPPLLWRQKRRNAAVRAKIGKKERGREPAPRAKRSARCGLAMSLYCLRFVPVLPALCPGVFCACQACPNDGRFCSVVGTR